MAGNKIYVQGSYIDVHDNENVYLSVDKAMVNMGQDARDGGLLKDGELQQDSRQLSDGRLARAIECSQAFFLGQQLLCGGVLRVPRRLRHAAQQDGFRATYAAAALHEEAVAQLYYGHAHECLQQQPGV